MDLSSPGFICQKKQALCDPDAKVSVTLLHEVEAQIARGEFVEAPTLTYPMEPYAVMVC